MTPGRIVPVGHVEATARRVRAYLGGHAVLDTTRARYCWERPSYPQYYVPLADLRAGVLVPEGEVETGPAGLTEWHGLEFEGEIRRHMARVVREPAEASLAGTVRFEWGAFDSWYEEDEPVFLHPRSPYVRVDALRSTRTVRVECGGELLAASRSPVLLFETGLPTRFYLDPTDVDFTHLEPSPTVTSCPYKGTTTAYWSLRLDDRLETDLAWSYGFPAREVLPIAGLIAFYNERVDLVVDGERLAPPPPPGVGRSPGNR